MNRKTENAFLDVTPTWADILPALLTLLDRGGAEGQKTAREELARMAQAADKWNAHCEASRSQA